ncbi:hypothetical protein EDD21DRAFT_376718 [Dissophora ornata]|nr:hypothetical protein BGZ58_004551 [Dissophora ornata]KAI8600579.1 hypothetical protein EDD21DRAFT_376718 [Dissophora ornata]
MKFSLKAVALSALVASVAIAAPIEKRDAASDRIAACFVGLLFTGSWPGSCQAAVAVNLGLIKSIAINQMTMDFTPSNAWAPLTSSNSLVATMLSIPGITLPIDTVRQHIIISDNGVQIGNIDTPWSAASVSGAALTTSFSTSTLNVFSTSHTAFSGFISALSTSATHPVGLQGSVDVQLNLGIFGRLTLSGIGFQTTVNFAGLNNLSATKYVFLIDTDFNTPGFIILGSVINIPNPSKLTLNLGDVSFSTATANGYVGISTVKNLLLTPGNNYVLSSTSMDLSIAATTQFLNDLGTSDATLTLTGFNATSQDVALNAGLAAVKTNMVVPMGFNGLTMSQAPYSNWSLKMLPSSTTDFNVQITATFQSPYYGLPISMYAAEDVGQDNYAFLDGVSTDTNMLRLFNFQNTLAFNVTGTSSATVTFNASLPGPFQAATKAKWQELVTYGAAHGYIPIQFNWQANIIVNNDGVQRLVDWGNTGTGLPDIHVAVGSDFANVLNAFPSS